eukprot:jgi/Botrbrau1/13661/Bobra.0292s0010.1
MNGPEAINALVEHLDIQDLEILLANRGLPSVGTKDELKGRVQIAFKEQFCPYEWERGEVPTYHAEIQGAGCTMCTHGNSIYVFGGMDEERSEHHFLWRWDLSTDDGFVPVKYRSQPPVTLTSGHYAAVYNDELWVFPGARNRESQRAFRLNLTTFTWSDRWMHGDVPTRNFHRRNVEALLDGNRLILLGGQSMEEIWFFDFENADWVSKKVKGGLSNWNFSHATKRGDKVYAVGSSEGGANDLVEVWELDVKDTKNLVWKRVSLNGSIPGYRIHCSAAVVDNKWILHGGRRPGKFNVTAQTWYLDFNTMRWYPLLADGCFPEAREWHTALGLQDCMVVVGGRTNIPDFEAINMSPDTMSSSVEMLWFRNSPPVEPPSGKAAMLKGLAELYNNVQLSDVTLVVGETDGYVTRIPAHRHILATHSLVWNRMWQCNMLENKTCEVHIEDFSLSAILLMLQYMYGCLPELPKDHGQVVEMFKAADKYDCPGLMKECVQTFRQTTEVNDIAGLLQVACERCSTELREVCIDLTSACLPNVVVTPTFQALIQANPDLGTAFIREVCIRIGVPSADDKVTPPVSEPTPPPSWGTEAKSTTPSTPTGCGGPLSSATPLSPTHGQSHMPARVGDGSGAGPSGVAQPLNNSAPWTPPRRGGQEYPASAASPTTPLHY